MPTKQRCIVCFDVFEELKPEHIFPAAIGGVYTCHNICPDCNERMGKFIDTPFVQHKLIATYRKVRDVKRGKRGIPDPMRGVFIEEDGRKYNLSMNSDGSVDAKMRPRFPSKEEVISGEPFVIQMDGEDLDRKEELIARFERQMGFEEGAFKIASEEKSPRSQMTVTVYDANNKVLLGFCKILYQAAMDLVPGYGKDKTGKKYAQMLRNCKLDYSLKEEINPNQLVVNTIHENILRTIGAFTDEHVIMLCGYVNVGLIGLVKVFNEAQVMVLSTDKRFANQGMVLVRNNFTDKTLGICKPSNVPRSKLDIMDDGAIIPAKIDLEFGEWNPPGKLHAIYDKHGNKTHNSIFDIVNDLQFPRTIKGDLKNYMISQHIVGGQLFIESRLHNRMLPIGSVQLFHNMEKIKER